MADFKEKYNDLIDVAISDNGQQIQLFVDDLVELESRHESNDDWAQFVQNPLVKSILTERMILNDNRVIPNFKKSYINLVDLFTTEDGQQRETTKEKVLNLHGVSLEELNSHPLVQKIMDIRMKTKLVKEK